MNAVGAPILSVLVLVVLSAPPRWALMGMMAGVLYLTQGQQLEIGGVNLFAVRFIELAGFIRVMARREFSFSRLNGIDRTLLLLYSYTTVVFLLRSNEGQAYQIGTAVDAFLCYFAFRGLITNVEDFRWFLRAFLLLLAPYVALVLIESFTMQNPFLSMGGLVLNDEGLFDVETWSRGGRLRCYGSFRHPSLLGTLGGSFLPFYIGLWFARNDRKLASIGIGLSLAIVWASNSGGPVSCVTVGLIGWMLWKTRTRMNLVRRGLAVIIVLCAFVMKAPVWYLLAKFSDLTGGDGWHRSYLLDVAWQNLDKWWLAGMPTRETATWFPYTNSTIHEADMTNHFLVFGITAGLGAMVLLVTLLAQVFSNLGKTLAILRSSGETTRDIEFLYWSLGVMLGVHIFNWLGITYFDQTYVLWFMQLAVITSLTEGILRPEPEIIAVGHNRTALKTSLFPMASRLVTWRWAKPLLHKGVSHAGQGGQHVRPRACSASTGDGQRQPQAKGRDDTLSST